MSLLGKHGLIGVTKNVAWRFKAEKIRCNALCPGSKQTQISMVLVEALSIMAYLYRCHHRYF